MRLELERDAGVVKVLALLRAFFLSILTFLLQLGIIKKKKKDFVSTFLFPSLSPALVFSFSFIEGPIKDVHENKRLSSVV